MMSTEQKERPTTCTTMTTAWRCSRFAPHPIHLPQTFPMFHTANVIPDIPYPVEVEAPVSAPWPKIMSLIQGLQRMKISFQVTVPAGSLPRARTNRDPSSPVVISIFLPSFLLSFHPVIHPYATIPHAYLHLRRRRLQSGAHSLRLRQAKQAGVGAEAWAWQGAVVDCVRSVRTSTREYVILNSGLVALHSRTRRRTRARARAPSHTICSQPPSLS